MFRVNLIRIYKRYTAVLTLCQLKIGRYRRDGGAGSRGRWPHTDIPMNDLHLLLVEDDARTAETIRAILCASGFSTPPDSRYHKRIASP